MGVAAAGTIRGINTETSATVITGVDQAERWGIERGGSVVAQDSVVPRKSGLASKIYVVIWIRRTDTKKRRRMYCFQFGSCVVPSVVKQEYLANTCISAFLFCEQVK